MYQKEYDEITNKARAATKELYKLVLNLDSFKTTSECRLLIPYYIDLGMPA